MSVAGPFGARQVAKARRRVNLVRSPWRRPAVSADPHGLAVLSPVQKAASPELEVSQGLFEQNGTISGASLREVVRAKPENTAIRPPR